MQKMPKIKMSLLLKVACIFLVVGVAVLSLGFVLGPSGYLYFDHGLKTGNNVTETSIDEETVPFNQIVFDYSEFDEIRIETGDSYKVEIKSKTPYFTPNYTVKGGVLTIGAAVETKKTAGHVLEITSNGYDSSAVITVPENAALSLVDIHELDTVEEYFGYSSIFFSRAYLTPKVTLNGLQVEQFSFACTADLHVQNCTVSILTSELDSYAQLDYRVKNSTVNEAVLTADTQTGGLYLHGTDSAFTRLQTDVSQVSLEGGSVQSADISADSLDCENVQFTDLIYDVQSALLTGCTAETIDGTADNQNKVFLNGSRADYALDLQASPAVEVIEKTVPYTDALYIYGYDTQQTAQETATVKEGDENYTNLYTNGAYISEKTEVRTLADGTTLEERSVVVYKERTLRYFVQNGITYYDVGTSDNVGIWNSNVMTMTHDEFEETLADFNTGGVYVDGAQAAVETYTAESGSGNRVRLVCTYSNILLNFSQE